MDEVSSTLTVYFDEPFWVGVYERACAGKLRAAKITFGAEPKDCEVYDFILRNIYVLHFGPFVTSKKLACKEKNPKRMKRAISSQIQKTGVGTKAQEALKLQQEAKKMESKSLRREYKEKQEDLRFALRQQKKKEKHKGH